MILPTVFIILLQLYNADMTSLDLLEISPFLNPFDTFRGPLMRSPTAFILLLQSYNEDLAFQHNFDTIKFTLYESFDF